MIRLAIHAKYTAHDDGVGIVASKSTSNKYFVIDKRPSDASAALAVLSAVKH